MVNITELPEDCLSQILSLTSPKDVFRSSFVSKQFLSASLSDAVWDKLLPLNCKDIVSRSCSSIRRCKFASNKDLFVHLACFPILVELGTKTYALDKRSGKVRYMLGARALWEENRHHLWHWKYRFSSSFKECAECVSDSSLEIKGRVHTKSLSPGTTYGAYFVFKVEGRRCKKDFGCAPVKVWVSEVGEDGLPRENCCATEFKHFYLRAPGVEERGARMRRTYPYGECPVFRGDGWSEIEMGRYQVGVQGGGERLVLEMSLKEVGSDRKGGLVIDGIELRPLF